MNIITIAEEKDIPKIVIKAKEKHFQDILHENWQTVFTLSPLLYSREKLLLITQEGKEVAWANYRLNTDELKFRNFMVKEEFRSLGVARLLLSELKTIARQYHDKLVMANVIPRDQRVMYLNSIPYFNSKDNKDKLEIFKFGNFLKRVGFTPSSLDGASLNQEDLLVLQAYRKRFPTITTQLKIFKLCIIDNRI